MAMNEQDKKTLQIGLFLAALILVGAIYCKFFLFSTGLQRMNNEIAGLEAEIDTQKALRNDLLALGERRDEIEALAQKILEASRRLPASRNAEGFYTALIRTLSTTGVRYRNVRPQPDRRHQLFTEIPYLVEANSAFHELGQFLNLIEENANRYMRVSHIDIVNDRESPTIHPVNLEITTFMLHDIPTGI